MEDLTDQLSTLMAEWKECHQKRGWTNFISDGAVNAELYEAAYPKILFFLKEAYSKGNDGDLWNYAEQDRAFLKKELELLKPDVIICGNNGSRLRFLYGEEIMDGRIDGEFMEKHRFAFVGDQITIDYYHPANQYPGILNYYTVCCLYQQALKQKNNPERHKE